MEVWWKSKVICLNFLRMIFFWKWVGLFIFFLGLNRFNEGLFFMFVCGFMIFFIFVVELVDEDGSILDVFF